MGRFSEKHLKVWLPFLILITLWSGSFLVARLAERALIEEVHERLVLALHAYESYLNTVVEAQERNLTLFLTGAIRSRPHGSKVPRFAWDYVSRYVPEAMGCLAFDLNGRLVAHTSGPGQPAPFDIEGVVPMNLTEAMVTDPTTDTSDPSGRSFYDIFLPVILSDESSYGSVHGTVACRLTNVLSQGLTRYRQELGLTGDVYLVSAKTRRLLTETRSVTDKVGRMKVNTEAVQRAMTVGAGRDFYSDYQGVPVMGAFLTLPKYGWILLAEISEDEAMAAVSRLRTALGVGVGVVSLAAGLLGWRYGRQLEEKERITNELRIAADIQRSILPHRFPPYPNRHEFELYAAAVPAREMGGDFFDFFFIDRERLALVIADVSGKGIPAALFMALTRTMLRATSKQVPSPADCLFQINNLLCHDNDAAMFVTVFYAILNTNTGDVLYTNAGHNHPYLLSSEGKVSKLDTPGGMALAAMPDSRYPEARLRLRYRDSLFLYTDGVTEAMDRHNNQFTEERLEVLLHNSHDPPTELVQRTIAEVNTHSGRDPQSDDITVMALRYLKNNDER